MQLTVDTTMAEERHMHCIIIGAGISGLDAAYYLQVSQTSLALNCDFANKLIRFRVK